MALLDRILRPFNMLKKQRRPLTGAPAVPLGMALPSIKTVDYLTNRFGRRQR